YRDGRRDRGALRERPVARRGAGFGTGICSDVGGNEHGRCHRPPRRNSVPDRIVPPVAAAFAAIGTAIGGALAVGAPLAGTHLLAGAALKATISSLAVKAFTQLAIGVSLSALGRAMA